jgi:hypothetical protein
MESDKAKQDTTGTRATPGFGSASGSRGGSSGFGSAPQSMESDKVQEEPTSFKASSGFGSAPGFGATSGGRRSETKSSWKEENRADKTIQYTTYANAPTDFGSAPDSGGTSGFLSASQSMEPDKVQDEPASFKASPGFGAAPGGRRSETKILWEEQNKDDKTKKETSATKAPPASKPGANFGVASWFGDIRRDCSDGGISGFGTTPVDVGVSGPEDTFGVGDEGGGGVPRSGVTPRLWEFDKAKKEPAVAKAATGFGGTPMFGAAPGFGDVDKRMAAVQFDKDKSIADQDETGGIAAAMLEGAEEVSFSTEPITPSDKVRRGADLFSDNLKQLLRMGGEREVDDRMIAANQDRIAAGVKTVGERIAAERKAKEEAERARAERFAAKKKADEDRIAAGIKAVAERIAAKRKTKG